MEQKPYQIEYAEFIKNLQQNTINAEVVGEVIARFAQYFGEANLIHANALIAYNRVARDIENSVIPETGKAISSAKAEVMSAATPESNELIIAKAHIENIEQKINALKSLQKGLMQEGNFSNNI